VPWSKVDETASAPVVGEHRYRVPSTDTDRLTAKSNCTTRGASTTAAQSFGVATDGAGVDHHGHGTARRSTSLTTWKCLGCGKSAVTDGCDPGRCLWRPCRYYGAGD
jgi:hypothetical protein